MLQYKLIENPVGGVSVASFDASCCAWSIQGLVGLVFRVWALSRCSGDCTATARFWISSPHEVWRTSTKTHWVKNWRPCSFNTFLTRCFFTLQVHIADILDTFGRPSRVEWHFQSELRYKFKDVLILTVSPFSEYSIFGHSSWIPITLTTSSVESARICTYNTNGKSGNLQRHMSSLQVK